MENRTPEFALQVRRFTTRTIAPKLIKNYLQLKRKILTHLAPVYLRNLFSFFKWSYKRESNPRLWFCRPSYYHSSITT